MSVIALVPINMASYIRKRYHTPLRIFNDGNGVFKDLEALEIILYQEAKSTDSFEECLNGSTSLII